MGIQDGKARRSKSSSTETIKLDFPIEWNDQLQHYKKVNGFWTDERVNFVIYARLQDYSHRTISKVLNKSETRVFDKIKKLEKEGRIVDSEVVMNFPTEWIAKLKTYKKVTDIFWTDERVQFLIYARQQNYSYRTIGKILNKSDTRVREKAKRLERDGLLKYDEN